MTQSEPEPQTLYYVFHITISSYGELRNPHPSQIQITMKRFKYKKNAKKYYNRLVETLGLEPAYPIFDDREHQIRNTPALKLAYWLNNIVEAIPEKLHRTILGIYYQDAHVGIIYRRKEPRRIVHLITMYEVEAKQ